MRRDDEIESVIEISSVFNGLRRRQILFLVVATVISASAAGFAFLSTPMYTAEATVVLEPPAQTALESGDVVSRVSNNPKAIDTEIELLRSRAMAIRVAERLAGTVGLEVFGDIDVDPSSRPKTDAVIDQLSSEAEQLSAPAEDPNAPDANPDTDAADVLEAFESPEIADPALAELGVTTALVEQIVNRLDVQRVATSRLIGIRYKSPAPQNSAIVANAFAEEYILEQLEAQFTAIRQAASWVRARLTVVRAEVREAEKALIDFRVENGMMDDNGENVLSQRTENLIRGLAQARLAESEAATRYRSVLEARRRGTPVESISEVMASTVVRDLRRQQAEVSRVRGERRAQYRDDHPQMRQINQEMEDLQRQIETEVERVIQNLRGEMEFAAARVRVLEQELGTLQKAVAAENPALVTLRELEREAVASRELFQALLERQKELNERERLAQADARIISRATPPDAPSEPRRKLIFAAGGMLALVSAMVVAFAAEAFDQRVKNTNDLRHAHGFPTPVVLLAKLKGLVFSRTTRSDRIATLIAHKPRDRFVDSLRALRVELQRNMRARNQQLPFCVAFTSAFDREDRATAAYAFATLLAADGGAVCYVDMNYLEESDNADLGLDVQRVLRDGPAARSPQDEPKMTRLSSRSPERRRLLDTIEEDDEDDGSVELEPGGLIRQHLPDEDDDVDQPALKEEQPAGPFAEQDDDLPRPEAIKLRPRLGAALSPPTEAMIDGLMEQYDFVVLDVPALLENAEAAHFASYADASIHVVEWRQTKREAVSACCDLLENAGASLLAFVVSKVDFNQTHFFGPDDRKALFGRRGR